jgi:hypothetical protein
MSRPAVRSAPLSPLRRSGESLRVAFLGPPAWLDVCLPADGQDSSLRVAFAAGEGDPTRTLVELAEFCPDVSVILDPISLDPRLLAGIPGVTLAILVGRLPEPESEPERTAALQTLDRVATFVPALTGERIGEGYVWRAFPVPVADRFFADVRPVGHPPRAMSIGRSTSYRETMLMPVKHHHDLLQVIHGVNGDLLSELLGSYDVGVYVSPEARSGFGLQVALHLAAGQLLFCTPLYPAHGLERDIDYLQFDSAEGLVWSLQRLGRFPEMYQRVRVRGRMKAEQYRASSLFARIIEDLLADVRVFGRGLTTSVPSASSD